MATTAAALKQRLAGTPTVGLIGLGYVGLPLAVAFAESGATVVGVDLDAQRVAAVRAGRSFVEDVPSETVARLVTGGRLRATEDVAALKDADAIVVCVPTPQSPDGACDTSIVESVVAWLETPLIILRSTVSVGTTRRLSTKYRKNIVFQPEYGPAETPDHPFNDLLHVPAIIAVAGADALAHGGQDRRRRNEEAAGERSRPEGA